MNYYLGENEYGFVEVINKPTSAELQKYYHDSYYQEAKGAYETFYSDKELEWINNCIMRNNAVIKMHNYYPKTMLDVGCGEGFALSYFKKMGVAVKGIDYSLAGVSSKNPDCLENVKAGDLFSLLEREVESGNKYDLVWVTNVLEHVLDPIGLLDLLKYLVSTGGGVSILTVPNDYSMTQLTAKKLGHIPSDCWVSPPDHLSYFNYTNLLQTLTKTGWKVVDVIADFPIDWFLFNKSSNYILNNTVGKNAHYARIDIDTMINSCPVEDVISFYRSMAKLGMGRDITVFMQPIQ